MDHEPSQLCDCKQCLIIYKSYHTWKKLRQNSTDAKSDLESSSNPKDNIKLLKQSNNKRKTKETIDYSHFEPPLDCKNIDSCHNTIHKFDNNVIIRSINIVNNKIHGGWIEKKSDNLGKWRKRYLIINRDLKNNNNPLIL
eukprot:448789_1